jgi:hypothetical protein
MTSITVTEIRKTIDDMDEALRAAIENGDIETVFRVKQPNLVSFFYNKTLI